MSLIISELTTEHELYLAARLRYEVNVAEMQLDMRYADHRERTVREPLDLTGHIFGAFDDGQLVGSVRVNLVRESDIGFYHEAYGIDQLPVDPSNVSITTRLAVLKPYRGGRVPLLLPRAAYKFFLESGITHDIIDSRQRLAPYFTRMGYQLHTGALDHPEFGAVVVQALDIYDRHHLESVGSPFVLLLDAHRPRFTMAA